MKKSSEIIVITPLSITAPASLLISVRASSAPNCFNTSMLSKRITACSLVGSSFSVPANKKEIETLISEMKSHLGEKVKDIKSSQMLTDSPVCLTADEAEMDIHLERLMRQHKRLDKESKKILEINASHDLIKSLAKIVSKSSDKSIVNDVSHLLLDQARIVEGELPLDTKGFTEKLSSIITRSLSA